MSWLLNASWAIHVCALAILLARLVWLKSTHRFLMLAIFIKLITELAIMAVREYGTLLQFGWLWIYCQPILMLSLAAAATEVFYRICAHFPALECVRVKTWCKIGTAATAFSAAMLFIDFGTLRFGTNHMPLDVMILLGRVVYLSLFVMLAMAMFFRVHSSFAPNVLIHWGHLATTLGIRALQMMLIAILPDSAGGIINMVTLLALATVVAHWSKVTRSNEGDVVVVLPPVSREEWSRLNRSLSEYEDRIKTIAKRLK